VVGQQLSLQEGFSSMEAVDDDDNDNITHNAFSLKGVVKETK
jgi:hypothetical protein